MEHQPPHCCWPVTLRVIAIWLTRLIGSALIALLLGHGLLVHVAGPLLPLCPSTTRPSGCYEKETFPCR
jgi:hypothetical protein